MLLAGKLNELTSIEKKINEPEVKLDAVNAAMLDLGKGDWQSRLEQIRAKQMADPLLIKLRGLYKQKNCLNTGYTGH